jgi:PAS domain-containing protein
MMVYINGMVPGSAVYLVSFLLASFSVAIHKYNEKNGLLQENNALREFAEIAPSPIVQYTEEGFPLIWNPEMEKETGYSKEEIIAHYNEMKTKLPKEEWQYIIMRFLYK